MLQLDRKLDNLYCRNTIWRCQDCQKIGPWSEGGGTSPFSMAVDEENLVAIYTFRGVEWTRYRYELADGRPVCDSGSVHAINLTTGDTIWQWVSPYAMIGDWTCDNNQEIYDSYVDVTLEGNCQQSFDGGRMKEPIETIRNIVVAPDEGLITPPNTHERSILIAPSTISNNNGIYSNNNW